MKTQREFLEWTKANLGFSKSTTYEYIISYRVYSEIASKISKEFRPPMYQSHCQLLSKVPHNKLVETWMDVCRQAANGVITTAFLEGYLDRHNLRAKTGRLQSSHPDPMPSLQHTRSDITLPSQPDGEEVCNEEDEGLMEPVEDAATPVESSLGGAVSSGNGQSACALSASNSDQVIWSLPINENAIFEVSKKVVLGGDFDLVLHTVQSFQSHEHVKWGGRIWMNLTPVRAMTTSLVYSTPSSRLGQSNYSNGLEHLLRVIFTKFASGEFTEGLFLLRAEFGADWFTPILQHPHCVLRHTQPPVASGETSSQSGAGPISLARRNSSVSTGGGGLAGAASNASRSTTKRLKRSGGSPAAPSPPAGNSSPPPFESYVMFYLGPRIKEFCHVFRSVGLVPGINSWSAITIGHPSSSAPPVRKQDSMQQTSTTRAADRIPTRPTPSAPSADNCDEDDRGMAGAGMVRSASNSSSIDMARIDGHEGADPDAY
ncbi:hypothetical protein DFJ73DRAFT_37248 [Zopfochytrium polystomum]|nr:hypothetical protein DFJ73DRAFT_37248 [Zopfochytrium polystomum]